MTDARRLLGIAGWSGGGKTTLIVRLIPALRSRGLCIATIKHAHHDFDIDTPGKDSHEHRSAGAVEVAVSSSRRWAIVHENRGEPEPALADLVARMSPADLYLVEGYKSGVHEKIEIHRRDADKPLLHPEDETVIAVASDCALPGCTLPVLDLEDIEAIADFVVARCGLQPSLEGSG